jgi:hypothetical protein
MVGMAREEPSIVISTSCRVKRCEIGPKKIGDCIVNMGLELIRIY